ncbi:MAG: SurA N-terminal domain-containing protein [Candidatus Niyogibacteria bacterium]|nr:SurA N-terminal domain-containing protein [Candidatus Niyogibacteria bacterium]
MTAKKWIFYGVAAIGVLFIALVFFWRSERYPILAVNGVSVSARDYNTYMRGFERYRRLSNDPLDAQIVKRAVLMSFVADVLVRSELERRGIAAEAEKDVETALAANRAELEKAASELYGWNIETFRRFALDPQARQLALSRELEKEGKALNDWLREALLAASVSVYGIPYEWSNGQLNEKK